MKTRCRHLGVLSALAALAAGACVGPPDVVSRDDMGSLSASLTLSPTTSLNTASYAISGPNAFARSGSIDVSHSQTISVDHRRHPGGQRLQRHASPATATDGVTTCTGSATFAITAEARRPSSRSRSSAASRRGPAASRSTAPSTSARWSTRSAPTRAR